MYDERHTRCKSHDTCPDIPIWLKNEVSSHTNIGHCMFFNDSWEFQWSRRSVYAPWDSFVNQSINWPINTLLIENLAFGKYEVAVL